MALGVMTLLLALSVMHGFEDVVTQKIIGFDTHIRIEKLFQSGSDLDEDMIQQISDIPGVTDVFPIVRAELMLKSNSITDGALLEAMPLSALNRLYSVSANLQGNSDGGSGLIMGAALAEQLKLEIGDPLLVYDLGSMRQFSGIPNIAHTTVQSIYESGMEDYDRSYLYSSIENLNRLFPQETGSKEWGIFLNSIEDTERIVHAIDDILPYSHLSITWKDRHQTLFNWMKTQEIPIFAIFSMIMVVAIVNIASTLILIILEKRTEIGTLRALGTSKRRIQKVFALEGFFLGLIGTGAGLLLSLVLAWLQNTYGIISLPAEVYFMDRVNMLISGKDIFVIATGVILLSVISSILPAMQASKLHPAEALREE
ncbi:MAG: FtsX-like permease family protein [Candidatus Marinimicrobia bacterium]|nr:FtsX-like permease family protein [Candidatus Neomarinimicrobiota bacterium]